MAKSRSLKGFRYIPIFAMFVFAFFSLYFQVAYSISDIFTLPQNISNNTNNSVYSSIATNGTAIFVTWRDYSENSEILFSKSIDGGITFSTPQNISTNAGSSYMPDIAANGTNIFVIWHDFTTSSADILFSKSVDSGTTFSTPQNISNNVGDSFVPDIAINGTEIFVTWNDNYSGTSDILFSKSVDSGTTFSTPQNISNTPDISIDSSIVTNGTAIFVAWTDYSPGNGEILFSKSIDGGTTFSTSQNISNNTGDSDFQSIATNGTTIFVTWRDYSENYEIFFSKSIDGGTTFSTPQNISNNVGFSYMPSIAVRGSDIFVVWYDFYTGTSDILFSKSIDGGTTFSTPQNISNTLGQSSDPSIVTNDKHILVSWSEKPSETNEIFFSKAMLDFANYEQQSNIDKCDVTNSEQLDAGNVDAKCILSAEVIKDSDVLTSFDKSLCVLNDTVNIKCKNTQSLTSNNSTYNVQKSIPNWIKNNAGSWGNNNLDDKIFVNDIQFLIQENIIHVDKNLGNTSNQKQIPDWIKNNAKWWSENKITDVDFTKGIEHLVKIGIIKVN